MLREFICIAELVLQSFRFITSNNKTPTKSMEKQSHSKHTNT